MSDPNNPYGNNNGDNNPYGQQPDQTNPYGQQPPAYGQQPPAYGQNPYGEQNPYGQAPYAGGAIEKHPQAVTILVLGIIGLICCQILSPIAWVMGNKAVKEIDASPGRYEGRDLANVGKILGIIGTVLMILSVVIFAVFLLIGLSTEAVETSTTTTFG